MTEPEWLACGDPGRLIKRTPRLLKRTPGPRNLRLVRLVGVACCRSEWDDATDADLCRVVDVAERFADGLAAVDEMAAAERTAALFASRMPSMFNVRAPTAFYSWIAVYHLVRHPGRWGAGHGVRAGVIVASQILSHARRRAGGSGTRAVHADLVRDIAGNPFRPVRFAPEWRTADAAGLAEAIYDRRAFCDLPILADALEDAGCDSADLLGHLRGPGPHARGCWAVDLVLGRE